jgi:hypothetical protein
MIRKTLYRSRRALAAWLSISLFCTLPLGTAQAGMLGTDALIAQQQSQTQRQDIQNLLAREDVAAYLRAQGVNGDDLQGRLNSLSDAEISQMHAQLAELPAGGDILGTIVVIIVIFMLLDMGGITDVFPRI